MPSKAANFVKELKVKFNIGQVNSAAFLSFFKSKVETLGYSLAYLKPEGKQQDASKTATFAFSPKFYTDEYLAFYLKNRAFERTHMSPAMQTLAAKSKKLPMAVSDSKFEDQLMHYHRLFVVEKLDPHLHGIIEPSTPSKVKIPS